MDKPEFVTVEHQGVSYKIKLSAIVLAKTGTGGQAWHFYVAGAESVALDNEEAAKVLKLLGCDDA